MTTSCPFEIIVITAPTESIAVTYRSHVQLLQKKVSFLQNVVVECVSDPEGARVGSGGGTIHALNQLVNRRGVSVQNCRIVIIHSGGDSRRCPIHSVCGKAWMQLDDDCTSNPLILLLKELSVLFQALPQGAIVVASGDVLVDFRSCDLKMSDCQSLFAAEGVFVVAVAARDSTATNHGVLCSESLVLSLKSPLSAAVAVSAADLYLQKPTVAAMRAAGALFGDGSGAVNSLALIDTGVVVFTSSAAERLYRLADFVQDSGLYRVRFELYNELLCSCATARNSWSSFDAFAKEMGLAKELEADGNSKEVLRTVFDWFSVIPLQVMFVRDGQFTHVGTSNELVTALSARRLVNGLMKNHLTTVNCTSWLPAISLSCDNGQCVAEHCDALISMTQCPRRALISQFTTALALDPQIVFAEDALFQHVFLHSSATSELPVSALLSLSIDDDVKASCGSERATIWRLSWPEFFERLQVQSNDIWGPDDEDRSLWSARLFPVFQTRSSFSGDSVSYELAAQHADGRGFEICSAEALLLSSIVAQDGRVGDKNRDLWRCSRRLSLRELLADADAADAFFWRSLVSELHLLSDENGRSGVATALHNCWRSFRAVTSQLTVEQCNCALIVALGLTHFVDLVTADDNLLATCLQAAMPSVQSVADLLSNLLLTVQRVEFVCSQSSVRQGSICLSFMTCLRDAICDVRPVVAALLMAADVLQIRERELPRLLLFCNWLCDRESAVKTNAESMSAMANSTLDSSALSAEQTGKFMRLLASIASTSMRVDWLNVGAEGPLLSTVLEAAAQRLICFQVQSSLHAHDNEHELRDIAFPRCPSGHRDKASVAQSPVRIDCGGGWSDTPPICYDQGGSVLNVAVKVDGQCPIRCVTEFTDSLHLRLTCWRRNCNDVHAESAGDIVMLGEEVIESFEDLRDLSLTHTCALLRACALLLLFRHESAIVMKGPLAPWLRATFDAGLAISCFSDLPAGSGMGGSSILASTVLKSLGALTGMHLTSHALIYLVSEVEQLLTTGGGWQDQIGGCFGGFKISRSPAALPLSVSVEPLPVSKEFISLFNSRTALVFTGQQRLAKNTLLCALQQFSVSCYSTEQPAVTRDHTVSRLIHNAETGALHLTNSSASDETRLLLLAQTLSQYWALKVDMAAQSEPPAIATLLSQLRPYCIGLSLCGAGAGGFAVCILPDGSSSRQQLRSAVARLSAETSSSLSMHEVEVDEVGVHVSLVPKSTDDIQTHLLLCNSKPQVI